MTSDRDKFENWMPIAEAAQHLRTTPLNVLMHIKRGFLLGQEHDGEWLVAAASLAALLRRRGQGDVPEVCQGGCSKAGSCASCG